MARYSSVTDPDALVGVSTTITQKMREDLRLLVLTQEHQTIKSLITGLIQKYLDENADRLEKLAEWRRGPVVPAEEPVVPTEETVAAN